MSKARRSRAELRRLELQAKRARHGFRGAQRAARGRGEDVAAARPSSLFPPLPPPQAPEEPDLSVAPTVDESDVFSPAEMPGVRPRPHEPEPKLTYHAEDETPRDGDASGAPEAEAEAEADAETGDLDATDPLDDDNAADAPAAADEAADAATDDDSPADTSADPSTSETPTARPVSRALAGLAGAAAATGATVAAGGRVLGSTARRAYGATARGVSAGTGAISRSVQATRAASQERAAARAELKKRERAAAEKAKAGKAAEDAKRAAAEKAEADKRAAAEAKRAEAAKKAEQDAKEAAAAKQAEQDAKEAAAAKKAEQDAKEAAAAKQAEQAAKKTEEKKPAKPDEKPEAKKPAKPARPAKPTKARPPSRPRPTIRPAIDRARARARTIASPTKKQLVAAGGGVAIALVGYTAAQIAVADTVAPGVQVLGVDIGGMGSADARTALAAPAADINATEILFTAEGWVVDSPVADAGLAVDVDATVDSLTGFTLAPSRLWSFVTGGEGAPVAEVDTTALANAIESAADSLDRQVKDADVLLRDGRAYPVSAAVGVEVDQDAAMDVVVAAWPASATIELPSAVEVPHVPTEEARRSARVLNEIAFASESVLESPNGNVVLTPTLVTDYGDIAVVSGRLNLVVDGEALAADLLEQRPSLENGPRNARLGFDASQQYVVFPGVPARAVDAESLGEAVVSAVSSFSRSAPLPYVETPPEVSTEDVADTPFTDRVSTFFTPFTPRGWARERNIENAARLISGRIVQPGEIFSLDAALYPIVGSNGFRSAGVIIGGEHTDAMGGGLSQMATTLYNAAYFAGMEDIQHREHSEWFARYPAGREATLWSGVLDVKFRNNTPYPILINSYLDGAGIRVDFWSTPYYDEVTSTQRYSRTPRQGCAFKVWDTRTIILDGEVIAEETQSWSYRHTEYCV